MWSTRDLALIILLAAIGLVSSVLIVQTAGMITGIPGINFVFTIFLAIQTSFSLLMYQGRRWRFFVQMSIFYLLIIPTFLGGAPFDVLGKTHFLITAFLADLVVNSIYPFFNNRKRLQLLSCLSALFFWVTQPFASVAVASLLFAPQYVAKLTSVVTLLLPVIVVESLAGGYFGYQIYRRINKEQLTN